MKGEEEGEQEERVMAGAEGVVSNTEEFRMVADATVGKTDPDLNDMGHLIENMMIAGSWSNREADLDMR